MAHLKDNATPTPTESTTDSGLDLTNIQGDIL